MNRTLFISILLAGFVSNAKLSPGYDAIRKMDTAVATLAKGGGKTGLATKNPGDVMMAGAIITLNKTTGADLISVDTGGQICTMKLTAHQPPPGISGATSYSAAVISCTRYVNVRAPDLMKYEDVRISLEEAAAKGNANLSFSVVATPQGNKVKLKN